MPRTKKSGHLSIGIDLGGTKIAAGLVNSKGDVLAEAVRPTGLADGDFAPKQGIQHVVSNMADLTLELLDKAPGATLKQKLTKVRGVGLASAGPMNVLEGKLINPANFPGWKVVPLVELLTGALQDRRAKLPVHFQNDAIAAALGEGWVGSARGCSTYVMITLGTGIGSGVIINGKPAQSGGMGSEWGHSLISHLGFEDGTDDFYASTVEGIASGTGLLRLAKRKGFKGSSVKDLAEAVKNGETKWEPLFENAARAIAGLCYNLSLGFNLEKIVVTGGLMHIKELFLPRAKTLYKNLITQNNPDFLAPFTNAQLGNRAGFIGAARLAFSGDEKTRVGAGGSPLGAGRTREKRHELSGAARSAEVTA